MNFKSSIDFKSAASGLKRNEGLTMKLPKTRLGRKTIMQISPLARIQSHRGSIHSPHKTRKIRIRECQKSSKFHLKSATRVMFLGCVLGHERQRTMRNIQNPNPELLTRNPTGLKHPSLETSLHTKFQQRHTWVSRRGRTCPLCTCLRRVACRSRRKCT